MLNRTPLSTALLFPLLLASTGCGSSPKTGARAANQGGEATACSAYASVGPWDGWSDLETQGGSDGKPTSRASFALFLRYAATGMSELSEGIDRRGRLTGKGADALGALGAAAGNEANALSTFRAEYMAKSHIVARLDAKIGSEAAAIHDLCSSKQRPWECGKVLGPDKNRWVESVVKLSAASDTIRHAGLRQHLVAIRNFGEQEAPLREALEKSTASAHQRFQPLVDRFATAQKTVSEVCGKPRPRAPDGAWIAASHTSPRKLVAVIASQPGPGLLKDFERAAADEDQAANPVLAATYRGAERGGFGSGFFLVRRVGSERHVYLVTNRHVISGGSTVEVRDERGEALPSAEVLYEDWSADLAVLSFPDDAPVEAGFAIAGAPVHDGDAVTVAGFPGLGARPAYQITRGSVSNERLDLGGTRLLQHTAATDPGGSGGPVLDGSGLVVGVSAAKAREREAASLAVPRQDLLAALDRALETEQRRGDDDFRRDALTDSCLLTVSALQDGHVVPDMVLSQRLIEERGIASYGELLQSGSEELQQGLGRAWTSSPLDALRAAVAIDLTKKLSPMSPYEVCAFAAAAPSLGKREVVEVPLSTFRGSVPVRFRFERGRYKIESF